MDRDSDIKREGINALQSQMKSLVTALSNLSTNNSPSNRKLEHRLNPPDCSMVELNYRLGNNCYERSGRSHSHRWDDCQYRNFKYNPTSKGQGRLRSVLVNTTAPLMLDNLNLDSNLDIPKNE